MSLPYGKMAPGLIFLVFASVIRLNSVECILISGKASEKSVDRTNVTLDISLFKRINIPGKFAGKVE